MGRVDFPLPVSLVFSKSLVILVFLALPYVTFAFYLENKSLSEYVVMVTGMVCRVITPRALCYERET